MIDSVGGPLQADRGRNSMRTGFRWMIDSAWAGAKFKTDDESTRSAEAE